MERAATVEEVKDLFRANGMSMFHNRLTGNIVAREKGARYIYNIKRKKGIRRSTTASHGYGTYYDDWMFAIKSGSEGIVEKVIFRFRPNFGPKGAKVKYPDEVKPFWRFYVFY